MNDPIKINQSIDFQNQDYLAMNQLWQKNQNHYLDVLKILITLSSSTLMIIFLTIKAVEYPAFSFLTVAIFIFIILRSLLFLDYCTYEQEKQRIAMLQQLVEETKLKKQALEKYQENKDIIEFVKNFLETPQSEYYKSALLLQDHLTNYQKNTRELFHWFILGVLALLLSQNYISILVNIFKINY